jgi:hydrogenase-4 membrane subunit HyfE
MPLSSIVVIIIRLFALNWFFTAVPLLLSAAATPPPHERTLSVVLTPYAPGGLLLIFAAGLGILSRAIARFVSRGVDTSVSIGSLSRADLYSFAFVFLGLFFILSSFADVINWIHYFAMDPGHDPRVHSLYQLTRAFLTFALGLILLLGAPRWTKKLVARDQKAEAA